MQLDDFINLYQKYDEALHKLSRCLRRQYHIMHTRGYKTAFSDVEGELMYMLIRETQPETVFEISPASGWSTNYILAALTHNDKGMLHSFELDSTIQGQPTEQVIRSNTELWNQERLSIYIGDARQTIPAINGAINFLLLDSCHEDWFAQWYIDTLFPRVDGPVIVQDIAFRDQLEPSTEAKYVWDWLDRQKICVTLFGFVQAQLEQNLVRAGYSERRGLRTNAVLFFLPQTQMGQRPELDISPENLIQQAQQSIAIENNETANRLLNEATYYLLREQVRANRHRSLAQAGLLYTHLLGAPDEAQRCFQRALGIVVQQDVPDRIKGFPEIFKSFVTCFQWRLAIQTGLLILLEPLAWPGTIRVVKGLVIVLFRKIQSKIFR